MDYVRVDYENGLYAYYKNNVLTGDGTYRSSELLKKHYEYIRLRRLAQLPEGKKTNYLYDRSEK